MFYDSVFMLEEFRNDLFSKFMNYRKERDDYRSLKTLSLVRGTSLLLEDIAFLTLCNDFFGMMIDKGEINREEAEIWKSYGLGKMEFIYNLTLDPDSLFKCFKDVE